MKDPLLFGVAEGLKRLLPPPGQDFPLPCALRHEAGLMPASSSAEMAACDGAAADRAG